MCGRTACTLDPGVLPSACQYKDCHGRTKQPKWKNNDHSKYSPSYNMSPQSHTPVLVSPEHKTSEEDVEEERVLQVMKWGLVPSWHKGDPEQFGYKMNNARIESITEKRSFKGPLEKGRRCVVLAEGFYEWQAMKDGGQKQPYFIYFKNEGGDTDHLPPMLDGQLESRPMLTMAGIYDEWKASQDEEPLFSYSVITLEAMPPFNSIHHRVPAILKDDNAVKKWLDSDNVGYVEALKILTPDIDCLEWHPVSKSVNNSRYKESDCVKAVDLSLSAKKAEKSKITNWFQRSTKKREASEDEGSPSKKLKKHVE